MKRARRGILWLFIAFVLLGTMSGTAFAQYDLSKNTYIDVKKTPSGKTGQNVTVNMVFTNDTSSDLKGVAVLFDRSAAEEEYEARENDENEKYTGDIFPFEINSSTFDAKILGTVKSGSSKNFSLSARVRRDIAEGYYVVPLEVKIEGSHAAYEKVNIWVTKASATTESNDEGTLRFELGEGQNTPFGIYPEVLNFDMNLRNASNITAFDVNVRMGLSEDSAKFPFDINDGNYTRHYDRIGGGETIAIPYSMMIRKDVYSGYYPITFTIEYRDSTEGDIQKDQEVFYVKVQNKDKEEETREFNANDRTKARIIVDGFETIPETVYAGEEFELILHMKNASENVLASNLLFTLESEKVSNSAVFTADSGSSSIAVNALGAGQTTDLRLKLRAGAWVDQRTYAITINEKYDSPEFKNAEEKVSVDIPVKQVARLNTGTIEVMPDSVSVGSETNVMFPINNTGKVLLYNVMVTFVGDSIQETDSYVGNIKPGESGNVDAMITAAAPTMDDGKVKILITYEDENGVVSAPIEKEFALTVTEQMEPELNNMDYMDAPEGEAESSGNSRFLVPGLSALLAAGAAGVFFFIRRSRKKKREKEEESGHEI